MGPDNLAQIATIVENIRKDYDKAKEGNKSACVRVRKAMGDLKKLAQVTRLEMAEIKTKEAK